MTCRSAAFSDVKSGRGQLQPRRKRRRKFSNGLVICLGCVTATGAIAIAATMSASWMIGIALSSNLNGHGRSLIGPQTVAPTASYHGLSGTTDIAISIPAASVKIERPVMTFAAKWTRATALLHADKRNFVSAPQRRLAAAHKAPHSRPSSSGEVRHEVAHVRKAAQLAELIPPTSPASALTDVVPLPPRRAHERTQTVPLPRIKPTTAPSAQTQPKNASATTVKAAQKVATIALKQQIAKARPESEIHTGSIPPQSGNSADSLSNIGSHTAIYDIEAHTVYLPDGRRLEAHSGLGRGYDNPRYVEVRMHGPTPPNLYDLTLREHRFHGVRAIRLNPVDESKMHGRAGMLAHTYMLGPSGASFGCVSFKDYQAFLHAYLDGEIARLRVVAHLDSAPTPLAHTQPPHLTRFAYNY